MPNTEETLRRKRAGLCVTCGKREPKPNRVQCQACLDRKKQYAKDNAEHIKQVSKQYAHANYIKDPTKVYARLYERRLKAKCILGGRCVGCGNTDHRVLEFNHKVDGDGTRHRNEIGPATTQLVNWIIKYPEQAKDRIELLCANCHAIRHSYFRHVESRVVVKSCHAA